MSCVVYITNKTTGQVYAYRSESYRDPITKKPRSRRTYLGRVDAQGNIIPKAEKGRRNTSPINRGESASDPATIDVLQSNIDKLSEQMENVEQELHSLIEWQNKIDKAFHNIGIAASVLTQSGK